MKKGISPVLATALLLVVSVIFVVGFQTWFTSFQQGLAEDQDYSDNSNSYNSDPQITIQDKFIESSTYYVKSYEDKVYKVAYLRSWNEFKIGKTYRINNFAAKNYYIEWAKGEVD